MNNAEACPVKKLREYIRLGQERYPEVKWGTGAVAERKGQDRACLIGFAALGCDSDINFPYLLQLQEQQGGTTSLCVTIVTKKIVKECALDEEQVALFLNRAIQGNDRVQELKQIVTALPAVWKDVLATRGEASIFSIISASLSE